MFHSWYPCTESNPRRADKLKNIIDKPISVDDETLDLPLQPVKFHRFCSPQVHFAEDQVPDGERHFPSILRDSSCPESAREPSTDSDVFSMGFRRVSFPVNENELASYREPESPYPWIIRKILFFILINNIYNICINLSVTYISVIT